MIHEVVNNKLDGFSNNKLLVLDFYADWCNPCQALAPVLDKIANDNQDITFLRINVDNNQDLSDKYNILSIPTLILINDGRVIETSIGVISENVLQNKLDLMKQA
ncbi:MAG TPA: thioredoxin [Candidatus Cloacimonadota bacterium]|nr:thioredoxin [Candidatus Cloacimonadota bacterium]HPS37829.1 thioredoxin [Candidatus Cloacimonadota bacterium]